MKGLSPTQRTLRALREQGRLAWIVEKWNPYVGPHGIRQDLAGFIDVIALDPKRGFVAIQSTGQAFAEHERKILDSEVTENVIAWLKTPGGAAELWGWRKVKLRRGGKAERWEPRVRVFTLADFPQPAIVEPSTPLPGGEPF